MSKYPFNFNDIKKTYLIAEIGINHNGEMPFVEKMIDYSTVFGWDCVKLQKRNPDKSVPEHQKDVLRDTPWGKITYLDYRNRVEFNKEQYDQIKCHAGDKIHFTASVWDVDSAEFMSGYDIPFVKIPSAHLTNDDLINYIGKKGIPMLVSTGMSSIDEIDHAVELLKSYGDNFALMHTNSSYPAHENELNLSFISVMKERYGCVVGYSGHEFGLVTTTLAVALGAKIIERHVTLSRTLWGTDQMVSVEPQGMMKLISQIRASEIAIGDGKKKVYDSELPIRKKLRGY